MSFIIQPEIFERFPKMQIIGLVAWGLNNAVARPEVTELWQENWQAISQQFAPSDNVASQPRIKVWQDCFRAIGVSNKEFPSAIEALLRRAKKGDKPFYINPLVDFYNAISLRHLVPLGGFDLLELNAPLEVRLTRSGDTFTALDAQLPVVVAPGEVAYASGQEVLVRHLMWRQAKTGLITTTTRSVVLVGD